MIVQMDNAAFEDDPADEVRNLLQQVKSQVEFQQNELDGQVLRDRNGNTVGSWAVTDD